MIGKMSRSRHTDSIPDQSQYDVTSVPSPVGSSR